MNEKIAKKFDLHPFKLYRIVLDPLNLSNVSNLPGVEFLTALYLGSKKRMENLLSYVQVLHKTLHKEVLRHTRAVDVKEMF